MSEENNNEIKSEAVEQKAEAKKGGRKGAPRKMAEEIIKSKLMDQR